MPQVGSRNGAGSPALEGALPMMRRGDFVGAGLKTLAGEAKATHNA
ncbi:MAG: hypothetical protein ACYDCD_03880 [Candidatus Acidiferrales bacterium]